MQLDLEPDSTLIDVQHSPAQTMESNQAFISAKIPNMQPILGTKTIQDIQIVTRESEILHQSPNDSEIRGIYIQGLTIPAAESKEECIAYRRLFDEAKRDHATGKVEVCRAKCIQIVHSNDADAETKACAYRALAAQASNGKEQHFLEMARSLEHFQQSTT